MLQSSLGFHTLTLMLMLDEREARHLMRHFKEYSEATGLIKIFPVDAGRLSLKYEMSGDGMHTTSLNRKHNYRIVYYSGEDRGIEWLIRYNNRSKEFKSYIIEVTINPKILGGIKDYVTAATYADMNAAITNFNLETKRISPILRDFGWYSIKRIDYCINFFLPELGITFSPEKVMQLIRRANIPSHYKEWMTYSDTSHRMKGDPASFYLIAKSANIQFYGKQIELQRRSDERTGNNLSPIPQATLDSARNVIRFEIQYKYRKMYAMSNNAKETGNSKTNKYENFLSDDACNAAVNHYFNRTIGKGDWYTLQEAIRIIERQSYNRQREERLTGTLRLINQCRGIASVKASLKDRDLETFKKTLKDLSSLGINPVTIPKEWGVKHIPNLLYTYYDKVGEEKSELSMREWRAQTFNKYVAKHGFPSADC